MTQPPPPPPNQPPQQGGFGPPQDQPPQQPPPPPGYGYPQAPPPQQPVYGYPQAPQQPQPPQGPPQAAPPPGYGYPGQQPNPYAQPQQPNSYGQQPGYGYPGQQPTMPLHPQPGQPGGGGRKFGASAVIITAAVVAIALIVGGGIWYSSSSGKDDDTKKTATAGGTTGGTNDKGGTTSGGKEKVPASAASKVLFEVPMPKVSDTMVTSGSWLTDKVYAKSGSAEVVGYNRDTGAKQWTIKLPGPVCQATKHTTTDGKTAILYEPAMPTEDKPSHGCSQIAALDLNTGTKLWTKTANSGDQPISFENVTVSANTVAVGSSDGGAAFDISTGKVLWSPKATDCYDAGYGGGAKLVAVRRCGTYDSPTLHIQTIDPVSGKVLSDYKMAQGIEYASIVSTDPLVVAADVGDSAGDGSGVSDFFSIDNKTGALRSHIPAPGKQYAARCDGITRVEYCAELAVGNDRLYVPTEEHDGSGDSYSQTNEIVAFDLATGKQTGQRADAGDGYTITPLRMDGSNLLAYKSPPYNKGGQVVSIDGTSFKETKLLENPSTETVRSAETTFLPDYAEILYGEGHLYMSSVYADKASSSSTADKDLAIAFGTTS
ncbi:outer membrane protein assembly factor BamB family protein [Streptomyces prunicolor]|uniref:PQQ-binding-like beta-propeller repeat protein n=1 Tax=Streptomyces prunicolor TaxID=67348 RepID=A0ABU4F2S5_9ACTN|nr:PQQ-binding-like beta-propeller repeat protein [Streptomyces prunicolor]MDV7214882.1 PQQ-binding-like beta-propeller repeat protein [Streptomyces prunicolor]